MHKVRITPLKEACFLANYCITFLPFVLQVNLKMTKFETVLKRPQFRNHDIIEMTKLVLLSVVHQLELRMVFSITEFDNEVFEFMCVGVFFNGSLGQSL